MELVGLAAPEDTEEYDAAAFEAALTTAVEEEQAQATWYFFPDSGMNEEELSNRIDWLLNDSPTGAYHLEEVTYSLMGCAAYDEVEISFSYRAEAISAHEMVPAGTMLEAAEAVIAAIESGETEIALYGEDGLQWEAETVENLVSIASTNAITPAEFRDFSYSCYGGDEEILHLSMTLPLDEEAYGELSAELEETLFAAAQSFLAESDEPRELYRAAHDYVVEQAVYDDELAERTISGDDFSETDLVGRSAYGALCRQKTVCSGYAQAFQGLCRAMDLPCWTLYGFVDADTPEAGEHVWNMVLADGVTYYVDCTFDDGLGSAEYFFFTADDPQFEEYGLYEGWIMPW